MIHGSKTISMKNKIMFLSLFISSALLMLSFTNDESYKNNLEQKEGWIDTSKTCNIKDLDPQKFIELCVKKYDEKAKFNFVSFSGEFPKGWVKKKDVDYLISQINSKEKCCGYMNVFSSNISAEHAEVGGFATIFLKSYIHGTNINLGLNANPKVNKTETEQIMEWHKVDQTK